MMMAMAFSVPTVRVAPRPTSSRTMRRSCVAVKPVCALSEEQRQDSTKARASSLLLGTMAAALLMNPAAAQAEEIDDALLKCRTDFCREKTINKFGAQADYQARVAGADVVAAPVEEEGKSALEVAEARTAAAKEAAERKAAAVQRAATLKAQAEAAKVQVQSAPPVKAAPAPTSVPAASKPAPKPKHSLVGDAFAAVVPAAIMAAGAVTVSTGATKEISEGNFDGWVEKAKSGYKSYPNKEVLASAVALALATDVITNNLPLFNLLLPGLFQIGGVSTLAYLTYRYTQEEAEVSQDLEAVISSTLPTKLPQFETVTEKTTSVAKEASALVKGLNFSTLPPEVIKSASSFWEEIDNKPVFVIYTLAALVAVYGVEFVADLPVLSLVLPKTFELTGVIMALIAIDRYAVGKTSAIGTDVTLLNEKIKSLKLPGTE